MNEDPLERLAHLEEEHRALVERLGEAHATILRVELLLGRYRLMERENDAIGNQLMAGLARLVASEIEAALKGAE